MSGEQLGQANVNQSSTGWEELTNAEKFRLEKARQAAMAVDPEEVEWYQNHLDKLGDLIDGEDPEKEAWYREHPDKINQLILEKDRRKAAEKQKQSMAIEDDEDFGQAVRDVLAEEAATDDENEPEADEDFGQAVRDVLAEEEAMSAEKDNAQKIEDEEKKKLEEEALAKLEEEEQAKLEELERVKAELAKKQQTPLVAVNADFTHDKKELSHDFAEQQLNAEIASATGIKGFVKRIWKGTLFKKYFQKKYERQIFDGTRKFDLNGETVDIDGVVDERSDSAIKRFVIGVTEEYDGMVHTKAGEKLSEADAETTAAVKDAISWFAGAKIPEGGSLEDLRLEFENRIGRLKAERRDDKKPLDEKLINNYYEVALQARQRAEHGVAIDRVMEGFRVYNADVRNNIRTEAHRDNIDKIVDKFESSKIGQFIPAEIFAAAAGTAYSLCQTGARAALGAGLGIGASGVFAGLRERNRVTEDRARMMRDAAVGLEYSGTNGETLDNAGRLAKKRAKYEARIGGTLYDLCSAKDLTANLEAARTEGNPESLLQAIAEARVRVDYSDSEQKDLISYSSADKLGDERLALDIALIKAEKSLSEEDRTKVAAMREAIQKSISEEVSGHDADFRSERRKLAAKAAAKTVAIGATVFFGSQEIMAQIDPNKLSLYEKLTGKNTDATEETILAGIFKRGSSTQTIENISGNDLAAQQRYEQAGFSKVEAQAAWTETKTDLAELSPQDAATQRFAYDGWANNGTKVSDGNELRAYLEGGQFRSGMFGNSTINGQTLNYDDLAAAGRIKGYLTIGGAKFEVQGTMSPDGLVWGDNGVFTTATGETIKAIGDNGEKLYKYFEIALDNGTEDGITHIIPFATDVGSDAFSGTLQKVVETTVEHPAVYNYVKEIPHTIFTSGVVLPGITSRVGLGETTSAPETTPSGEQIIDIYSTPGYEPGIPTFTNQNPVPASETAPVVAPTPIAAPAPAEQQPVAASETPPASSPEQSTSFDNRLNDFFGNDLDAEGREILSLSGPATPESLQRVGAWWNTLSPETQQKVRAFEADAILRNEENGRLAQQWLQAHEGIDKLFA